MRKSTRNTTAIAFCCSVWPSLVQAARAEPVVRDGIQPIPLRQVRLTGKNMMAERLATNLSSAGLSWPRHFQASASATRRSRACA